MTGTEPRADEDRPAKRRLRWITKSPLLTFGVVVLGIEIILAVIASWIAPFNPTVGNPSAILLPPSATHLFGTDINGFDIFSQTIYAPRVDLLIAVLSTSIALVVGSLLGLVSGYGSGRGRLVGAGAEGLTRTMDILQAFPVFIVALALVGVAGPGERNVIIVLSFLFTPIFFRFVRAEALLVRELLFVEAARALGNPTRRIIMKHILPNSVTTAFVQASGIVGYAILLTAGLSFVGAGVRPPTPEWGAMISAGAQQMISGQWWTAFFPGVAMGVTVFSLAAVGEWARLQYRGY